MKSEQPIYYVNQAKYDEPSTRIFAVDSAMQALYERNLEWMQQQLRSVIIAVFNDHGGQLTWYRSADEFVTISPTPLLFKKLKSVSHIALGVYKTVSPYLECPDKNTLWHPSMTEYRDQVQAALETIGEAGFPDSALDRNRKLCEYAVDFMDRALNQGFVVDDLFAYAKRVRPLIK